MYHPLLAFDGDTGQLITAIGPNTRFVVTTRTDEPLALYDLYVDRGEPAHWIEDLKNALCADRLSDHRFWANAFARACTPLPTGSSSHAPLASSPRTGE